MHDKECHFSLPIEKYKLHVFFTKFVGKKFASAIQYENLKSNSFTSKYNNAKVFMYECHQTNEKWEIAEM